MTESEQTELEEARLISGVSLRDRKATAEFVMAYSDAVYAYLRRRLFPRLDLTEDLLQEVFLEAIRGIGALRRTSAVQPWLLGIARHKVQDYYRRRLREAWIDLDTEEPVIEERFDDWIDERQLAARVEQTLIQLPEPYQLVLRWRYWEKVAVAEMAARMEKTEKSVERLLARAREQFQRRWHGQ